MHGLIRIAWVDRCQLTRECISTALSRGSTRISAAPYEDVAGFIARTATSDVDLVVLHGHSLGDHLPEDMTNLREAGFAQPVILVTEHEAAERDAVKQSLRLGASGHLSTRSTGIEMAISSFAFAHAGGTFAAMNLLLSDEQEAPDAVALRTPRPRRRKPVPQTPPVEMVLSPGATVRIKP